MALNTLISSGMGLSDMLEIRMKKSAFEKTPHRFLPQGALDRSISEVTIVNAMGLTQPTPVDHELVHFILTRAKRLFATATYIELKPRLLYKAMSLFCKNGFDDERLPIEEVTGEQYVKDEVNGVEHLLAKLEGPVQNEADRVWTFRKIFSFQQEQGRFLAPVLSTDEPNHDFWDLTLPFITKHASYAEGSFGVVNKYEIHGDHIQDRRAQVSKHSQYWIKAYFLILVERLNFQNICCQGDQGRQRKRSPKGGPSLGV